MSTDAAQRTDAAPGALTIRAADPSDTQELHFILGTWRQNYWKQSPWGRRLTAAVYIPGHEPVIQRLLARSQVLVAVEPSVGELVGYLVFELKPKLIHWTYVKDAWRRAREHGFLPEGVATSLVRASGLPADLDGVTVTHATFAWLGSPPLTDKSTGRELKRGTDGLQARYPRAITNPYVWVNRSNQEEGAHGSAR